MSRYHSYLNSAVQVLDQYKGEEPFAPFLKKFFSLHRKYGSSDRKQIGHLCYSYFRLGKAGQELPVPEKVLAGLFLCSSAPGALLETLRPEWNAAATLSLPEKCMVAGFAGVPDVFPWKSGLSKGIDAKAFNASFFTQPDLFLRLRPGKQAAVLTKLEKAGQSFEQVTDTCIALPNTSKVGDIIALDQEAIVQDYNSQGIGDFMRPVKGNRELMVWDCCAASGGKSILAVDILGPVRLVVSDIRESILANLKKRFQEAGINQYRSFCADLSGQDAIPVTDRYDLVICDVPCTGSGTWGRTPEQLHYFDPVAIERYAARQKKILLNVLAHVRPGGYLLYSTCSVFREENEAVVEFICAQSDLVPEKKEILTGYDRRADTLFGTLLRRPL